MMRLRVLIAVFLSAFALIGAGAALGATPIKGGSYSGSLAHDPAITVKFKVSSSGKRVSSLTISNTPLFCQGGGPATPVHFKNAAISAHGAFTSTGRYVIKVGPLKGQLGIELKITGKFSKGRREQGTLTTTYLKAKQCSGKSAYATSA
jgi:hypothetical protein